jgi:hypothetical protein
MILVALTMMALAAPGAPELSDKNYDETRRLVLPTKEEVAYREIPWKAALWDAVVEARDTERPILLWAMNGHPLGCT